MECNIPKVVIAGYSVRLMGTVLYLDITIIPTSGTMTQDRVDINK